MSKKYEVAVAYTDHTAKFSNTPACKGGAMNIPEELMKDLRQRIWRLEENDRSKDSLIVAMSPENLVKALSGWHFGNPDIAVMVARWMEKLGADPGKFTLF